MMLDARISALDARILAYEHAHHVDDTKGTRAGAIAAAFAVDLARGELDSKIAGNRKALARLRAASRNSAGQSSAGDVPLIRDNTPAVASLANLRAREARQFARRSDLATRYLPGSPALRVADAALGQTDAAIAAAIPYLPTEQMSGPDPVAEASSRRRALAVAAAAGDAARRDALAHQSAQLHRHLDQLIADTPALMRMLEERQVLGETYAGLTQQLEEARKFETPDRIGSTNLRILSPPEVIGRSNSPAMIMAASLFAAIMVAANAVLVLASLRDSFLVPAEVERTLGVPVLYTTAAMDSAPQGQQPGLHRLLAAMHHAAPISRGVVVAIAAPTDSGKARRFSTELRRMLDRRAQGRTVLVRLDDGAPLPATLPATLAATGDAELAVHPLEATGGTILDRLAQRFDTVLMIAPFTGDGSEIPVMAQTADLTVLVLTADVSSRADAQAMERRLARCGARATVAVLLDRHYYIPRPLYRLLFGRRRWQAVKNVISASGNWHRAHSAGQA